ncbi:hypothetical protein JMJ35_006407 [Cladonia borealis]|uniref:Uncharacterized protein n=1 Tax=Cladonia borealis TaxID=184061 RepID=A0AA39V7S3_9LECA|nr:hypothetical protein JMJ35_006407 [Cladonia borealis]
MEQITQPFGDDFFPALQKLSVFLKPYVKPVILATTVFSLPHVVSAPGALIAPQAIVPVQLLAVAYLSGLWKFPDVSANLAVEYAEPLEAFYVIWNSVGAYFKVGFLVSLAGYMPIYHGVPLPFQPWLQGLVLFAIAVVGYFSPTTKFVGPVRFGYLRHAAHLSNIYRLLLDYWSVYAALFLVFSPAILPSASLGLGAMSAAAWIHVYREYVGQRAAVAEAVAKYTARASLAASAAQEDAAVGGRYEAQLAAAATAARHGALQAHLVRSTDFFDSAATAWAAMGSVTQTAQDAVTEADGLIDAANQVVAAEKPDEDNNDNEGESRTTVLAETLLGTAQDTLDKANDVVNKLHLAQEAIDRSLKADKVNQTWRRAAKTNAEEAAKAVKTLAKAVKYWPNIALSAASAAADTQAFADQALAAATEGEMEKAWKLAESAKTSADEAKGLMEKLRSDVVGKGNRALISWLEFECLKDEV